MFQVFFFYNYAFLAPPPKKSVIFLNLVSAEELQFIGNLPTNCGEVC